MTGRPGAAAPPGDRRHPDVVLVMWDTVRAADVSTYGAPRTTTPVLDRLAERALVYERTVSPSPWTIPSHASLFTGLLPSQHGAHELHTRLDDGPETLAEVLGRVGYETVAVSANDLVGPAAGLARGFRRFVSLGQVAPRVATHPAAPAWVRTALRRADQAYTKRLRFRRDYGAARANRWVDRALSATPDDRPLFLFVNFLDAHLRYWPPEPYRSRFLPAGVSSSEAARIDQSPARYYAGEARLGERELETLRGLYRGEIAYLDARLGELGRILRRRGRLDRAWLIVTSDHGENIGDHGLMDHQSCLYETLLRVPLVVRPPGGVAGRSIAGLVQTHDLAALVASVAGAAFGGPVDALMLPLHGEPGRTAARSEYLAHFPPIEQARRLIPDVDWSPLDRGLRSVQDAGGMKLIEATDGANELYDVGGDPGEVANLIGERPADADRLRALLPAAPDPVPGGEGLEDAEIEAHLRTLGYLE